MKQSTTFILRAALYAVAALILPLGSTPQATAAAGNTTPPAATAAPNPRPDFSITPAQKARLLQALAKPDRQYDPAEQMLKRPFSSPGYHTALGGGMVHSTRDSLGYAVALLDTGDPDRIARAAGILRRVIALQDQNPASKTYGIWSWFMEEPLSKMSPPDWNWADFCGVHLLQVALDHRDKLPADLMQQVDASIRHAARSIRKRDIGPGYTNIAIMGAYVTLVTAELYHDADLKAYAMARFKKFYDATLDTGSFAEYNSPTYTVVALQELGRMRLHVRDAEARRMVEAIYRLAWNEIAQHFHAPTRQWAGPHSRAYSTLLDKRELALIERATDGRVVFGAAETAPTLGEARLPLPCPRELEPLFTTLTQPRSVVETFVKGELPIVGTTYLAPRFTLGTINRCDLWNQRRNLLAYWGSPEKPSYLHLRFLKNGYDLAAAQFFSVQREGLALAGINFATDGGDTHVSLAKLKDGVVKAKDLRLRFEFGGEAGKAMIKAPGKLTDPARLQFEDITLGLVVPYAFFHQYEGQWKAGQDTSNNTSFLDIVLYQGEEKEFNLNEISHAALGIAVGLVESGKPAPKLSATRGDNSIHLFSGTMSLEIPVKPARAGDLRKAARMQP